MDADGSSDPYVKVDVDGHSVQRTKIAPKTLNPEWDEQFIFMLTPAQVRMCCFDVPVCDTSCILQYRKGLDRVSIYFNCWDAD
jgi:Ca2+-dependent lipid-binding protein